MSFIKSFKLDLYACKISVIAADDIFEEEKKLYNKYGEDYDDYMSADGLCLYFIHDHYYILLKKDAITHNLIAHELYHTVCAIMDHRIIDDEEARAWLIGYVTSLIYQAFDKAKIEIKNGH